MNAKISLLYKKIDFLLNVSRAKKKVVLFLEIDRVKIFSSPTCLHSRMCIRIYLLFQTKKHTQNTKKQLAKETKENRKTKETKDEREKENVVAVNNICGKSNGIR